jgi:flagellar hook-associated protein 2
MSTVLTSSTNVLESAIPGLRLTLKGVTASPASITVGAPDVDRKAITDAIKNFVTAYNAVVDTTRAQLSETRVKDASTTTDLKKGALFGDTTLTSMLSRMRTDLRDPLASIADTTMNDLADLGIGVPKASGGASSDDAKAGRFTIDETKLSEAVQGDWSKVQTFLDAFAGSVDKMVDRQTNTAGDGLLDSRVKSGDSRMKVLQDSLDAMNRRLDAEQERYKAQFAAMETAMANYQTQQSWLTGQLAALNNG